MSGRIIGVYQSDRPAEQVEHLNKSFTSNTLQAIWDCVSLSVLVRDRNGEQQIAWILQTLILC